MRKSVWLAATAAAALLGFSGTALAGPGTAGDVRPVTGLAEGTSEGGTTVTLSNGDPVNVNDTIRTGPLSGVAVNFLDNSMVTIGENSEIVIDEFVYTGGTGDVNNIDIVVGAFRFASGQMNEAGVSVETPSATLGFRGTIASGSVDAQGNGFVNCETGLCEVDAGGGNITEMTGGQCAPVQQGAVGAPQNSFCLTGDAVIDGLIGSGQQGYEAPWQGNLNIPNILNDLGGQQHQPSPNGPGGGN